MGDGQQDFGLARAEDWDDCRLVSVDVWRLGIWRSGSFRQHSSGFRVQKDPDRISAANATSLMFFVI